MEKRIFTPINSKGYTLLEVSLFLAISGMLAAVALIGLAPRLRNVRFTQSVRGIETSLQKQSSNFQSGLNLHDGGKCTTENFFGFKTKISSGSDAGGTSEDCITNGRLIVLNPVGIDYYPVISSRTIRSAPACNGQGLARSLCFGPTLFDNSYAAKQSSPYPNGVVATASVAYGYLQDPEGTQIYSFTVPTVNLSKIANNAKLLEDLRVDTGANSVANCVYLGSRNATLTFTNTTQSLKASFNSGCH